MELILIGEEDDAFDLKIEKLGLLYSSLFNSFGNKKEKILKLKNVILAIFFIFIKIVIN